MTRYLASPCCGDDVLVPVDVTVHLRVSADGKVTKSLANSLKDVRQEAVTGDCNIREAYCAHCGESVTLVNPVATVRGS